MKKMKLISIIWGLFLILTIGSLTIISLLWKEKQEKYKKLENILVEAAKAKSEKDENLPQGLEVITYTFNDLKDEYIDGLKNEKDICTGYVEIKFKDEIIYKAFIKCKNYTTKGYIE